jgi:hypothetical protein
MIDVPIISGDRVLGTISIENYEREDAFGEPTCACSARSPAAWACAAKARLFDETQRL